MMIIDHRLSHLSTLRSTISVATYPIEYLVGQLPSKIYSWSTESFSARKKLLSDNEELFAERMRLEVQLKKLPALEQENTRLRKLLSSVKYFKKERLLVAELLSIDLDPFRHRIVLNKGTRDEVYDGQPLLGAEGIIGQIDKTGRFNSIAILISDPNHAILGVIARSGQRSLVVGTGEIDKLELLHTTSTADIHIGDLVITSGLDNRYPTDYPIAEITNIQRVAGETFTEVEAKPLVDLSKIREILLIWPDSNKTGHTENIDNSDR